MSARVSESLNELASVGPFRSHCLVGASGCHGLKSTMCVTVCSFEGLGWSPCDCDCMGHLPRVALMWLSF